MIDKSLWDFTRSSATILHPSADGLQRISFQGKEWVLVGTSEHGGAIATKQAFEHGDESYAHLYSNGEIRRYGEVIGSHADITFLAGPREQT